jgi:hypothetical protein
MPYTPAGSSHSPLASCPPRSAAGRSTYPTLSRVLPEPAVQLGTPAVSGCGPARPLLRHLLRPVHRPPQEALPALMGLVRLALGPLDPGDRLVLQIIPPCLEEPRAEPAATLEPLDRSEHRRLLDGCSESMAKPRSRVPYTLGRLARCALHRPAPAASGHPEGLISSLHAQSPVPSRAMHNDRLFGRLATSPKWGAVMADMWRAGGRSTRCRGVTLQRLIKGPRARADYLPGHRGLLLPKR